MFRGPSRKVGIAATVALLLASTAAHAARPKSGRLTAMALPGGPVAGLVGGGADPDRVWAFTSRFDPVTTFWRSDDAGDHWLPLGDHPSTPRLLVPSPHDRDVLYAVDISTSQLYASQDAGVSFHRIDDGSLAGVSDAISSFAVDPFDPTTVYAGASNGIWISRNGGAHWLHAADLPSSAQRIAADPMVPGKLWARDNQDHTQPLWRSLDGGLTWGPMSTPFHGTNGRLFVDGTHTSRVMLTGWLPASGETYRDDRIFETTDDGATWRDLGAPLPGHAIDSLAVEAGSDGAVWANVKWDEHNRSRLFRRGVEAAGWTEAVDPHGQQTDDLFASPTHDVPILAATRGGIRRYVDGHWQRPRREPASGQSITVIGTTGVDPSWVFVGTEADGLWRGLVSGEPWERISPLPDSGADRVAALAVSANRYPAAVYVAVACPGQDDCLGGGPAGQGRYARIFRSDCEGCSWQAADDGLPIELRSVSDLAVDPSDADTVWATVHWGPLGARSGGVWRSRDGGRTWALEWRGIDDGNLLSQLAIAPDDPDRILLTAARSLFDWQPASESWRLDFEHRSSYVLGAAAASGGRAFAWSYLGNYYPETALHLSLNGDDWQRVDAEFSAPFSSINAVAVTRDAPDDLWVVNSRWSTSVPAGLWRSRDGGDHFDLVAEQDGFTSLATFPDDRGVVFIGTGTGLYRWIDACEPDADTLCLDAGRMRVEGSWQNRYDGSSGQVVVRQQSDVTGVLAFSDLANPELIVKAIDLGRPRPEIFVGQLTDLDWQVRITDTRTGERQLITNNQESCPPPKVEVAPIGPATCSANASTLCLLGGRLRVRATWDNQYDGSHGFAGTLPYSPLASWLTFVDPTLPELLLKALDFGDRTLLYWGALTDLGYRLTVDDLRSGVSRSYTNAPRQRCGGSDTWATP